MDRRGFLIAACVVCLASSAYAQSMSHTIETTKEAVVGVTANFSGSEPKYGSGFVIDAQNGLILTAAHLLEGASSLSVRHENGAMHTATVIATDDTLNVALIRVDQPLRTELRWAQQPPHVGQDALAVGRVMEARELFAATGTVASVFREPNNVMLLDVGFDSGMSGAPIINDQGEVIGMAMAIRRGDGSTPSTGFAVPLNALRAGFERLQSAQRP